MIAALKKAFYSAEDKVLNDGITAGVAQAKQQNEAATARLKDALCEVLDGPNCECRSLKVVNNPGEPLTC